GVECKRGIECAAKIVALLFDPPELVLADLAALVDILGEGQVVDEVTSCDSLGLARGGELLGRELANRLEHPEARLALYFAAADQALVEERLKRVEIALADLLGGP